MSELNEYKKERQELIEARKFKTHVTGFEKETSEAQNPMNLGERLENFWYHYKYLVLSAAFILIVVVIVSWQFLSKPKYDISLTLVSENSFEGGADLFEQKLAELGTDQNGDGEVIADYAAFQLAVNQNTEMTPQMLEMTRATLLSRSSQGNLFLYLLDDTGYRQLTEVGMKFMDLSQYFEGEHVEGEKYFVKDSGFAEMIGLNDFFDGMYFCFADYYAYDEETRQNTKIKAGFEGDWALMQTIAALDEK